MRFVQVARFVTVKSVQHSQNIFMLHILANHFQLVLAEEAKKSELSRYSIRDVII